MIYILINSNEKDSANQWVKSNLDHESENTFTENVKGKCLISLPDNNSDYNKKMIERFLTIENEEVLNLEFI